MGELDALVADAAKIVSASAGDGTILAFKRSNGEQLLRMAGFEAELSTVTLDDKVLLADGMGDAVCLHDFTSTEDPLTQADVVRE